MNDGEPIQQVYAYKDIFFEQRDASECNEDKIQNTVRSYYNQPFNLIKGPLMRVHLFTRSEKDHVLLMTIHHIIFDGQSMWMFISELEKLYAAESSDTISSLYPLKYSYRDYINWQTEMLAGPEGERLFEYWQKQLNGSSTILNLPTDRPRSAHQNNKGAMLFFALKNELIKKAEYITINDLLEQMKDTAAKALEHQTYPFQLLVERLQFTRDPHYSPLIQVVFNFYKMSRINRILEFFVQGKQRECIDFAGLTLKSFGMNQQEGQIDLLVEFDHMQEKNQVNFKYNANLYNVDTIERMAEHFRTLLEGMAANPEQRLSELPLLTEAERHKILVEWNETKSDYPKEKCIHELFEEHVKHTPENIAVVFQGAQLSYRELNRQANQLAHYLQTLGVGPEILVCICMERSLEMIVSILGVLKAGGAYVPLDPTYPKERLAFMLEDSRPLVLLTQQKFMTGFSTNRTQIVCLDTNWQEISRESDENPVSGVTARNLAYVIYTSGSTGKPKGVLIEHRSVVVFLYGFEQVAPAGKQLSGISVLSYGFDGSVLDFFSILCFGGTLHILLPEIFIDAERFVNYLVHHGVTSAFIPPALLSGVVSQFEKLFEKSSDRIVLDRISTALEPIKQGLFQRFRNLSKEVRLTNAYGSTETTVGATFFSFHQSTDPERRIPIGTPISNYKVYILDSNLQPVPIGVTCEIFIGGDSLARGYLNSPELTAEKFIPNPFSNEPGARLYKTGDLARYLSDGNIEFLGRIDHQVKIRGFRIELGEIEVVLSSHPQVCEVVVLEKENPPGNKYLVAYVVPKSRQGCTTKELHSYLKEKLPEFMVPSAFVMLETIPMTPNGKVDRQALSSLKDSGIKPEGTYVAPRTTTEEVLAGIWANILGIERIGINDRFFDIGGNSLAAAQVMSRVCDAFRVELPLSVFFETQTIGELSQLIDKTKDKGTSVPGGKMSTISDRCTMPVSTENDWEKRPLLQRQFQKITWVLFYPLARVQIEGVENIPDSGPLIVAGNHINWLDSPLLFSMVGDAFFRVSVRPAFIAAQRWRKLFHWYFVQVGCPIYVRRGQDDMSAMNSALTVLQAGGMVGIGPEGTFDRAKLIKANVGVAYLATRAPAPVLPVVVYGQEKAIYCWKHLRRVPIHIRIGKPIENDLCTASRVRCAAF